MDRARPHLRAARRLAHRTIGVVCAPLSGQAIDNWPLNLGAMPLDPALSQALGSERPVLIAHPQSRQAPAFRAIETLGAAIA
jgi:MinD-like ATPase involved in chromosome partitioning or flagellar assembly